jgi:hypothetical protein
MCLAREEGTPNLRRYPMQSWSLRIGPAVFIAGLLITPVSTRAPAQELPKQQTNIDDNQLRAFAKVYVEVEKIRQAYEPRLKEAKDAEEGRAIQNDAVSKMQKALTKQGLSEENYVQIFEIARADEGLRKKLVDLVNEERH